MKINAKYHIFINMGYLILVFIDPPIDPSVDLSFHLSVDPPLNPSVDLSIHPF